MKNNTFSPTYVRLLDLLFKTRLISRPLHATAQIGMDFHRASTGIDSLMSTEDFYMNASELWAQCTPHEWYMIGRIGSELKYLCALWHCPPGVKNNSSNKKAIKGLIEKRVLFKTETTDIYLVNPNFIRRGDVATVIYTTASILQHTSKVSPAMVKAYKAVNSYVPVLTEGDVEMFFDASGKKRTISDNTSSQPDTSASSDEPVLSLC